MNSRDVFFDYGDLIRYEGHDYIFRGYCEEGTWPQQNWHGHVESLNGSIDGDGDYEHVEWLDSAVFVCKADAPHLFIGWGI